ncbi:MAG: hypothetical protein ACPGJV_15335 [Bacteriovoracaceae bacterium]
MRPQIKKSHIDEFFAQQVLGGIDTNHKSGFLISGRPEIHDPINAKILFPTPVENFLYYEAANDFVVDTIYLLYN